ncbi:GNAT family N-acetyltransferase [Formicincola oecophyllae]|uniref:GNAT family N-acetyltransferase n=1 Tax=Formicincola oecophyllae TaxID=2558361 RepID=A0A4Y6U859_9PROT|nr:GNAT family N-acetyltransferase [Formicincola oecophyllae]QDH13619.1 GNAT family N-acetyltransferase [Formicincola oecophyllae]
MSFYLHTARLILSPLGWQDMEPMARLKADGGAFGGMLGGVRNRAQAEAEMAADVAFWGKRGVGLFAIREQGRFLGMTGVHERPDDRGLALRMALFPWASGRGVAREAASAALCYTLDKPDIERVVAVAREDNIASRVVLGAIGMVECERFLRNGTEMVVYESLRPLD